MKLSAAQHAAATKYRAARLRQQQAQAKQAAIQEAYTKVQAETAGAEFAVEQARLELLAALDV